MGGDESQEELNDLFRITQPEVMESVFREVNLKSRVHIFKSFTVLLPEISII
jgi:hypothetical protein